MKWQWPWMKRGPTEAELKVVELENRLEIYLSDIDRLTAELNSTKSRLDSSLWMAWEPQQYDECFKTRLHTVEEGKAFAIKVAKNYGVSPTQFTIYRCRICPRHPATGQRFIHIANKTRLTSLEKKQRTIDAERDRRGVRIGEMISPEELASLRRKVNDERAD